MLFGACEAAGTVEKQYSLCPFQNGCLVPGTVPSAFYVASHEQPPQVVVVLFQR